MKKRDNKGQANIITTVLIMLVVIVALIIVWNVVQPLIKTSTEQIEGDIFSVQLNIENVILNKTSENATIQVKREAGKGDITELRFSFYLADGTNYIYSEDNETLIPDELETKNFEIDLGALMKENNLSVDKVSIIPVFGANAGIEVFESESKIKRNSTDNSRIYVE